MLDILKNIYNGITGLFDAVVAIGDFLIKGFENAVEFGRTIIEVVNEGVTALTGGLNAFPTFVSFGLTFVLVSGLILFIIRLVLGGGSNG